MQTTTRYSRKDLQEKAESVKFWWHSIDLGQGVVTKGEKSPDVHARELRSLRIPNLTGKSVLDIGAWDGFYSFEAEKRGAQRVVALDHHAWSLDLPGHIKYWRECKEQGRIPLSPELTEHWHPDKLPGKHGYDIAHEALNSRVQTIVDEFMTMDLSTLGTFDLVFFLGGLYHMENPLGALRRLASVTSDLAIIETHAIYLPGYENLEMWEFYSSNQLNADVSNWWGPNLKALEGMCRAAGFKDVEVVQGHSLGREARKAIFRREKQKINYFRAVIHAHK